MTTFGRTRRLVRPLLKTLVYALAFALPALAVIAIAAASERPQPVEPPPAFERPLPPPPVHDPTRPTAVVLAGNVLTESTDLLAPYEVLAASGAFNVYVVAPERRLSPLFPGGLDILPHYSLAEYDRAIGTDPALVVVPAIARTDGADAAVLGWLRARAGERTTVVSVCTGARVVAEAGLLAGRRATSIQTALPFFEKAYPEVRWVRGQRYVEDGRFISSAGITSGVDATLYVLQRFLGRDAAEETARRIGYPHTRFLDDRTWSVPEVGVAAMLPSSLGRGRTDIGLVLYDGVGEIELGSVADTYPYANSTDVHTVAPERRAVRSRNGLDLVPRFDLASAPPLDRVIVPGRPDAAVLATVDGSAARLGLVAERIHAGSDYPYDATLRDMARRETRALAASAAVDIEYPVDHLRLEGSDWPLGVLVPALGLGLLGLGLALGAERALRGRRRTSLPA
jgi:transcriptional regulator GlxA family with amidase domain